ncbi:hypothetical protein KA005_17025, partial [bacterium]|nr:hypothetical protein [bacterium]
DIVSHSMGAVSSRWYCAKLHPERIRTWISIAGANHGTDALCQFTTPGSKEMCPAFAINKDQSKIQIYLNGSESKAVDETPFGIGRDRETIRRVPPDEKRKILYYTIRIEPDSWIKPERSAILDGCGGLRISISSNMQLKETKPGNFLFEKTISHDHLPKDKDMITFVAMLLSVQDK